jgi:SAM-dependent methyltransferase
MPDLAWNKATWDGAYDWRGRGHEWSGPWGGSAAMFYATVMPRIGGALPADSLLELAPGHGRVTAFLLRFCRRYRGIDLSEQCVAYCRGRFAFRPDAAFHTNDGLSLAAVAGEQFDLVVSFDSLVHADMPVFEAYVPQILTLLKPGGVAFLHHSNLAAYPSVAEFQHRSTSVSAERVAGLVAGHGGRVLVQELFNGGPAVGYDCFTLFGRAEEHAQVETRKLFNPGLMGREGEVARDSFAAYLRVMEGDATA